MWKSPTLLSHSGEGEECFALLVAYILFKALRGLGVVSSCKTETVLSICS